ncbi:hypothetical protein [Subtercola sp. YIM 133946]|uniref:hypothetical protein n=1 Tax=Subtercola sp. YIM 133946 TaxID=3118909 RepID=UPI002F9214A7
MLAFSEFFYLVHAGQGRWQIKHRITDEPAGVIRRHSHGTGTGSGTGDGPGFDLCDEDDRVIASFDTIEQALAGLYADA